jgi:hypothetical protein
MKYLCLIYGEQANMYDLPAAELDAIAGECRSYDETLRENGRLIASERLQSVKSAATIRTRSGKVSVTDGPFAETKEQLAGFYLIEATDFNEAIRLASKIPPARLGCVEVRPVWNYRA